MQPYCKRYFIDLGLHRPILILLHLSGPFHGAIAVPCHALSLLSLLLWTSTRRRREWQCKTGGVRRLAVANGPNIFQMLLVYHFMCNVALLTPCRLALVTSLRETLRHACKSEILAYASPIFFRSILRRR